jgi:hypothetical protein
MTTHLIPDVFNGIAPIETTLVGAHPRLHLTSETLVDLRGKLSHAPWSRHFARVRRLADMKQLPDAALVYRLTEEAQYLLAPALPGGWIYLERHDVFPGGGIRLALPRA